MFKPLDKIETDLCSQFAYIEDVAQHFKPSIYFNDEIGVPEIGQSAAPQYFAERYNSNQIKIRNKFDEYINNKDIQEYLEILNVNAEKFWYLLLFVYDYNDGLCIKGNKCISSIREEFEGIINKIQPLLKSRKSGSFVLDYETDEPIELTLKIGKQKQSFSLNAIGVLCSAMQQMIENPDKENELIFKYSKITEDETVNSGYTKMAYYFCDMLKWFFDDVIKVQRKKGASLSDNEKGLFCHLLLFTEITQNDNILKYRLDNFNTLKGFIKPKVKPEIEGTNRFYH